MYPHFYLRDRLRVSQIQAFLWGYRDQTDW